VKLGKLPDAITKFNRVLEAARTENIPDLLEQAYVNLGEACQKEKDLNKAITAYSRAAGMIEAARTELNVEALRIGYFSAKAHVYRQLAGAFFQRYEAGGSRSDVDSAFYYAQLTQGRALDELRLGRARRNTADAIDNEYRRVCRQLQSLQRRLRLAPYEYGQLHRQLEALRYSLVAQRLRLSEHDSSTQRTAQALARSLPAVQNHLKQTGLGLLLYQISEANSYVVVATGDQAMAVRLQVSADSLSAAIDSLISPLHQAGASSVQNIPFRAALAHRLYQLLIKPVEQKLPLPQRLSIVPDLTLMHLPFEILLMARPEKPFYTPTDFPLYAESFLANRYTIVYSPTIKLLQESASAITTPPSLLVFANPFYDRGLPLTHHIQNQARFRSGWNFAPLPFTEVEAQRIEKIHSRTKVYRHEQAAEAVLAAEAPQHQVLHIASHAYIDSTFDAFCGLVLAVSEDSTDDGMLMGYEIADLKLNCDLVALSACKTGLGKIVAGEGILGLPRLFLGAGAKSVLITLWQVDDEFAADFMPEFYTQLLDHQLTKAEALAAAKKALLRGAKTGQKIYYQHPFYWAPFVLYGDPGRNKAGISPIFKFAGAALLILAAILGFYLRRRRNGKKLRSRLRSS
jgi:CHAT domain-containing protein